MGKRTLAIFGLFLWFFGTNLCMAAEWQKITSSPTESFFLDTSDIKLTSKSLEIWVMIIKEDGGCI